MENGEMNQPRPSTSAEKAMALAERYRVFMGNHLMIDSVPPQRSFSARRRVGVLHQGESYLLGNKTLDLHLTIF